MISSTIENIASVLKTGKTPPSKKSEYFVEDYNWYTPGDIGESKVLRGSERKVSQLALDEKKAFLYPENSLLITCIGNIGRVGIASEKVASNQQITAITPNENVDVNYLYYWFIRNQQLIENKANNAVVPILNNSTLKRIPISYPPLTTQKRIATILDDAQALKQKNEQLLKEYDELAQSIFLDMFGDPVTNPKGWDERDLKGVTSKIGSGATPKGGKDSYKKEGIPLIRSLNIHDNLFKYKDLAYIDDEQALKLKNVSLEKNDVLINITGASVSRCTVVPDNLVPGRVNQHVSILRPIKEELNSVYLLHLLISPNVKAKLLGVGKNNAATREAITKTQLQDFEICLPPLKVQNQFAEKIKLIEQQKELAKIELKESEDLFQALLQKAFNNTLNV